MLVTAGGAASPRHPDFAPGPFPTCAQPSHRQCMGEAARAPTLPCCPWGARCAALPPSPSCRGSRDSSKHTRVLLQSGTGSPALLTKLSFTPHPAAESWALAPNTRTCAGYQPLSWATEKPSHKPALLAHSYALFAQHQPSHLQPPSVHSPLHTSSLLGGAAQALFNGSQ